jgi:CubicO group peptidase (beta-lactamase class C family)
MLAAWVVEAVTREPLDAFVERRIYRPHGLDRTLFRPLDKGVPASAIAPTEVLAQGHLRGVVHDPGARMLGGVAGHAGLFASADDLAVLASALLWEKPSRIVCRDVLRGFVSRSGADVRWAVGWEMPADWAMWSEVLSPMAFGYTGFTGTSIWLDPGKDLFVILLTSRLNPTSANDGHVLLRRELHGVVGRAHTGHEADDLASDWRIPETWRGVDSCRAGEGFESFARFGPAWLAPLAW